MALPNAEKKDKAKKASGTPQMIPPKSQYHTPEAQEWLKNAAVQEYNDGEDVVDETHVDYKKSLAFSFYDAASQSNNVRLAMAYSPEFGMVIKAIGAAFESAESVLAETLQAYHQNTTQYFTELAKASRSITKSATAVSQRTDLIEKNIHSMGMPRMVRPAPEGLQGMDRNMVLSAMAEMVSKGMVEDLALIDYELNGTMDERLAKSVSSFMRGNQ